MPSTSFDPDVLKVKIKSFVTVARKTTDNGGIQVLMRDFDSKAEAFTFGDSLTDYPFFAVSSSETGREVVREG